MNKVLKTIATIFSLSFLALIIFMVYSWVASVKEINEICSAAKPGEKTQPIIFLVEKSQFARYMIVTNSETGEAHITIHSSANMGRHTCLIDFKEDIIVQVENVFLD